MGPGPGPGSPQVDASSHRKEPICLDFAPSSAVVRSEFCSTAIARLVAGAYAQSGLNNPTSLLLITPFRNGAGKSSSQRSVGHVALSSMVSSRPQFKLVPTICEPSKLVTPWRSKLGDQRPCPFNVSSLAFKSAAEAQSSCNISVLINPIHTNVVVLFCSSPAAFAALSWTRMSQLFFGSLLWYGCISSLPLLSTLSCSSAFFCQLFESTFITYLLLVQAVCKWSAGAFALACGTLGLVVTLSSGVFELSVAVVMPSFITRMFYMYLLASLLLLLCSCVLLSGSQPILRVRL